ncbi:hypothetical protein GCM10023086_22300 [Streptomyces venetus]|uniref:Uncharacterized protein n=1 Tax=Streptomyces venetus TaxID=1701086 RepID=A0ABP8FIX5_9ACTN
MGASQAAPFNADEIRRRCEEVLWSPGGQPDEQQASLREMEGYVRRLAPMLARLVPRMQEGMQGTARIVLRHSGELLEEKAPSADPATRLHDAGVNARALLGLLERPGELTPVPETPVRASNRTRTAQQH